MGTFSAPPPKKSPTDRDAIRGQILGLRNDMAELSKKKPDDPVNKFKLNLINNVIKDANSYLGGDNLPLAGFTIFDEDALPTNSDVMMVLSQYLRAL